MSHEQELSIIYTGEFEKIREKYFSVYNFSVATIKTDNGTIKFSVMEGKLPFLSSIYNSSVPDYQNLKPKYDNLPSNYQPKDRTKIALAIAWLDMAFKLYKSENQEVSFKNFNASYLQVLERFDEFNYLIFL